MRRVVYSSADGPGASPVQLIHEPRALQPYLVSEGEFLEQDYWAQAQALAPESAQICEAIWLCRCGEAPCGEPLPP